MKDFKKQLGNVLKKYGVGGLARLRVEPEILNLIEQTLGEEEDCTGCGQITCRVIERNEFRAELKQKLGLDR